MSDLMRKIGKVIREAEKNSTPGTPILMIGHPRLNETDFPVDPTMITPLPSVCGKCGDPVWSTEAKELIKIEKPNSLLLCGDCLVRMVNS